MGTERPNLLERIDQGRVKFELLGTPQSLARLDRFVVFARLGAGGMGVIYHAYDPRLDRGVAIKLLRPAVTAHGRHRRLLREARAMARLAHPNVVQVFEVGELEEHIYLVMEYVAGQTLRAWLAESPRTWREVVSVFLQAADGLAATHAHGLVHCDFKPENVLIGADGRARVGDFGLVQAEADAPDEAVVARVRVRERPPETTSTSTSLGGGTPRYMAPEQHEGRAADARSDQYGFCAALLEALAPARFESFVREAPLGLRALRGESPAPLTVAGAPPELGRVLARGLEPDPERRWPSMSALREALARLAEPRSRGLGWRWALAIGVAVGLLAGAGYGFAVTDAAPCDGGAAELAAVWGEPQRQQLRAAVTATGLGFAAETGARIEAHLDAHAQAWSQAHRAACEAHRDGHSSAALLDRTMLCLAADRVALAGLVQRLVAADAADLERAMGATLALPELARCRDAQALLAEVAPPTDAATTLAVQAVRSQLGTVRAEWSLGHLDDAARHAAEAFARALATGHAPLIVQALYHLGKLHHSRDARAEAEATLTRAAWMAAEIGDDEQLGLVAAALAHVVALPGDRGPEARTWVQLARAMTHRTAPRGRSYFEALFASGQVEHRAGRFAAAEEWFVQALAHAEQHLGSRSHSTLLARGMVALVQGERGEYDAALAQFERLAEVQAEVFGPSHPAVATHHNNRAALLRQSGREDEALAEFSQALAIWRAAYGPDHPDVGMAHGNIASALLTRGLPGDFELAEPHLRRAIATRERSLGPDDPDLAVELSNLGSLHLFRLELDEAERQLVRALEICERTAGAEHPRVVLPLLVLAEAAGLRGDLAAQRRHYERALKIQEASLGPEHPDLAWTLRGLAEVALREGALDLAEGLLARAEALDARAGADEERALAALGLRGRLALRRGDVATACDLLARSLPGSARTFDPARAELSSELARCLVAAGRADEARPLAEQAAAFYRRGGPALAWRVDALAALASGPGPRGQPRADVRAQ
ncbi:serine/threonine-protein kinase [Nannocystis bainbridge]|uniref:Tetratricopeptide repeat protein n=1 Tax=Nannocystis bainbridge TaxID=2995303 RepID=A0ABT5DTN9_9BACT|nr:serine/threonine-protein kinase [Nannocystis bainbridge]MDC0716525.1 tetratricopeptide repeat protein [Nannocystis bainbridge]